MRVTSKHEWKCDSNNTTLETAGLQPNVLVSRSVVQPTEPWNMTQEDCEDMRKIQGERGPAADEVHEPSADEMAKEAEDLEDYRMMHGII